MYMNNIVRNENGMLLPFEQVKANKDVILPIISEGNNIFFDILSYCVDNNIPTISCCIGHKMFDLPYITMVYSPQTCKLINGFLNRIKDISNVRITFSSTGFSNNRFCVTVYSNMSHRDLVFSTIRDCLFNGVMDNYLYNDVHVCLDIALTLDMLCETYNITVYNSFFKKKFLINLYGPLCKNSCFISSSSSYKYNYASKSTFYLYKNLEKIQVVNEHLKKMYDGLDYYPMASTQDLHYRIIASSGVYDKLNEIDYINCYLEENNGSVSHRLVK